MAKQRGRKPKSFYQSKIDEQELKKEEVSDTMVNSITTTNTKNIDPLVIDGSNLNKDVIVPLNKDLTKDILSKLTEDDGIDDDIFETLPNCEMFMPTLTGECKGEYVFKVRRVQAEIDFDSNNSFSWQNSQTIADTVRARIVTGVRYNEVFKNDYILKPSYDFMIKDKFDIKPRVIDINGELGFEIKATRKLVIKIEDEIATISFINK